MVDEQKISQTRKCYENYLMKISNGYEVRKKLNSIVEEVNKNSPFNTLLKSTEYSKYRRANEIEEFIEKSFPPTIYNEFIKEIDPKYKSHNYSPNSNLGIQILQGFVEVKNELREKEKVNSEYKVNYLNFLSQCFKCQGLHPDIWERSEKFKRFNILLEYQEAGKNKKQYRFLIPLDDFEAEYLNPFYQKEVLSINGIFIKNDQIKKIKTSSTVIKDEELFLFGKRYGFKWSSSMSFNDKNKFFNACYDETNHLIKSSKVISSREIIKNKTNTYVNLTRIEEISNLETERFDLSKLVQLLRELNKAYDQKMYYSICFITRAIKDHIPPIFDEKNYLQFASNFSGGKSIKKSLLNLEKSFKNIADNHIHSQIKKVETIPNLTQVDFSNDLDVLLSEIIKKIKKDSA